MNKILVHRGIATGEEPSLTTPADEGEIIANVVDRKVWVRDETGLQKLVADHIMDYDAAREYRTGDFCIESDILYRCNTAIATPEAFDPAKWDVIGGGGSAAGAILQVPTTVSENTIDTTGNPTFVPLTIQGDPAGAQTADLLQVPGTQTGDPGTLNIDNTGFPGPRFGAAAWREAEAGLGATGTVGQPLTFDGTWRAAAAGDPVYGVYQETIDNNTFVVRQSGLITNLDTASFAGGVITAGTIYVTSGVAGQLTAEANAVVGSANVLVAISATEGVMLPNGGALRDIGGAAAIGDTPPTNVRDGSLWYSSAEDTGLFIWQALGGGAGDPDSGQWVQTNGGDRAPRYEEFIDPADAASYVIVGNIMWAWGTVTTAGGTVGTRPVAPSGGGPIQSGTPGTVGTATVTFARAFATPPNVVTELGVVPTTNVLTAYADPATTTDVRIGANQVAAAAEINGFNGDIRWHAIGTVL